MARRWRASHLDHRWSLVEVRAQASHETPLAFRSVPDQVFNAVAAIGLGTVAAIVLFVPVAAYQYRRDGNMSPRDLSVLLSGAVYGIALWTYTLLPLPARGSFRCKVPQTDLFGTIGLIGLAKRNLLFEAWILALTPLYWICLSIAAWRALYQFLTEPYRWEKTEHGLARHSRIAALTRNQELRHRAVQR